MQAQSKTTTAFTGLIYWLTSLAVLRLGADCAVLTNCCPIKPWTSEQLKHVSNFCENRESIKEKEYSDIMRYEDDCADIIESEQKEMDKKQADWEKCQADLAAKLQKGEYTQQEHDEKREKCYNTYLDDTSSKQTKTQEDLVNQKASLDGKLAERDEQYTDICTKLGNELSNHTVAQMCANYVEWKERMEEIEKAKLLSEAEIKRKTAELNKALTDPVCCIFENVTRAFEGTNEGILASRELQNALNWALQDMGYDVRFTDTHLNENAYTPYEDDTASGISRRLGRSGGTLSSDFLSLITCSRCKNSGPNCDCSNCCRRLKASEQGLYKRVQSGVRTTPDKIFHRHRLSNSEYVYDYMIRVNQKMEELLYEKMKDMPCEEGMSANCYLCGSWGLDDQVGQLNEEALQDWLDFQNALDACREAELLEAMRHRDRCEEKRLVSIEILNDEQSKYYEDRGKIIADFMKGKFDDATRKLKICERMEKYDHNKHTHLEDYFQTVEKLELGLKKKYISLREKVQKMIVRTDKQILLLAVWKEEENRKLKNERKRQQNTEQSLNAMLDKYTNGTDERLCISIDGMKGVFDSSETMIFEQLVLKELNDAVASMGANWFGSGFVVGQQKLVDSTNHLVVDFETFPVFTSIEEIEYFETDGSRMLEATDRIARLKDVDAAVRSRELQAVLVNEVCQEICERIPCYLPLRVGEGVEQLTCRCSMNLDCNL